MTSPGILGSHICEVENTHLRVVVRIQDVLIEALQMEERASFLRVSPTLL